MQGIDFQNTKIAFESKSRKDLYQASFLFSLFGNQWLINLGKPLILLSLKIGLPIKGLIKTTIFKQFCGGEFIEDCVDNINELGKYNVKAILDYSVEGKTDELDFRKTANEIIATIHKAKGNSNIPFCVFKVTGIAPFGLLEKANSGVKLSDVHKAEFDIIRHRIEHICREAFNAGVPILIDAEESWIQNTIDQLAEEMMELFNKDKHIVFNTVQMYRHDRLKYIEYLFDLSLVKKFKPALKIVRGAYMEKERERARKKNYPSPIQVNKLNTDNDYDLAMLYCLEKHPHFGICAGTHNEESSEKLTVIMKEKNILASDKSIWFSQLLGMSDNISYNLAKANYNVAKYVPYGPIEEVMPYLIRRAEENTSMEGQTGRELMLIKKEITRRKKESTP